MLAMLVRASLRRTLTLIAGLITNVVHASGICKRKEIVPFNGALYRSRICVR